MRLLLSSELCLAPSPLLSPLSPELCPSVFFPSPSLCRSLSLLSWLTQPPAVLRSECVFNSALAENQNYRRISKQAAGAPLGTTVDNFHTAPSGKIVQVRNPF